MPAFCATVFVVFCSLIVSTCNGLLFNVSRGAQNVGSLDLFSNLDPSAKCPNSQSYPQAGRSWCLARKGNCSSQGCCMCMCRHSSATFQMKLNPNLATCVGNKDIRLFAGCTTMFTSENKSHPLETLDLSNIGSKRISSLPNRTNGCRVKSAEYLNINWKHLHKRDTDTFTISRIRISLMDNELRWTGAINSSYSGYIMKVNWECRAGSLLQSGCVVFKTKGTISRTFLNLTSKATPTRVTSTTQVTSSPQIMSTVKLKSPAIVTPTVTSATQVRLTMSRTSLTAPLNLTAESITSVTKATTPTKTTTATPSMTSQHNSYNPNHDVTESSAATSETLATESTARNATTIKPTYKSGESKDASKGENRCSCKEEEKDTMMVAIAVGVTAGICVFIVLLCLKICVWLIIRRRRKYRHGTSYCTRTTGIANPAYITGSQSHLSITGSLKNSVYDDAVYTELEERVRKSAIVLLGNPSYETFDDLLLRTSGAKDSLNIPLNNVQHKENSDRSADIRSNHRGKLDGETSVYQSLVIENAYDCADKRSDHGERTDGEKTVYQSLVKTEEVSGSLKPDLNINTYQDLNRESLVYQSLINNTAHKCKGEMPPYLTLINPSDATSHIAPNTLKDQSPNHTNPSPADVEESSKFTDIDANSDELEEISGAGTANSTSDEGPSNSAPLNNVLEGPGCDYSSAPLYAVLEGPDPNSGGNTNLGFEPPMYAALDGPERN